MALSYVRRNERWRSKLLKRSPLRCGSCSRRSWHQAPAVSAGAADDQAWWEACARPDTDMLDLSDVDRQLLGVRQRADKSTSVDSSSIDWQIVALVRSIEARIQELQTRRHGTSIRRVGS
jgi:hypothetical protein